MDDHPKASKLLKSKSKSHQKLLHFFVNLLRKKSKKSFVSVISHLTETYEKEGLISLEEKSMISNIAGLGDKKADSIMTPRADLIAIKHDATLEEIKKIIISNGHTRIPVFRENLDEIIGFIHSKDLAKFLCLDEDDFQMSKILRKILFVPGSMKVLDLMLRMRISRVHVAIVLDEFGGVDGFVTIDNVMEEIVGNIEDEHDIPSDNAFFRIKKINDKMLQVGGRVEISQIEEILQTKIKEEDDDFQTIAGLVMATFRRVPEIGEETERGELKFKIVDSDSRSVKLIEVRKH